MNKRDENIVRFGYRNNWLLASLRRFVVAQADGSYSNLQSEDSFEEEKEDNDSIVVDDEDKRKRP
eukprot:12298354-Prorocentrum_lima.AAC.1